MALLMSSPRDISNIVRIELSFGEWLEDRIKAADMTQTQFGNAVGVEQPAVSQWVRDVRIPKDVHLRAIARVLDVSVSEVTTRAGRPTGRKRRGLQPVPEPITTGPELTVSVVSRVPADAFRWMQQEGGYGSVQVPRAWMRGRSERDVFAVEVSGDCLRSHSIVHGDRLFCEWRGGRTPRDGDLVIVRIEDEVTCKLYYWVNGFIELRDGDGNVTARVPPSGNVDVQGFVLHVIRDVDTESQ